MNYPVLYSFRRCPYAMRARLALAYAGIKVELREVNLRDKPAELLRVSPKATVPVLVLSSGEVIDESLDIMLYALSQSDPQQWLISGHKPAIVEQIEICDQQFKPILNRYKYPERYETSAVLAAQVARKFLQDWETAVVSKGYLYQQSISLLDMAVFPFIRQFAQVDRQAFSEQWPMLQQWLVATEETELYQRVMQAVDYWQATDDPVFWGGQG